MSEVRTRFAPSPTGFVHIGGARTAFYAYLLAKHFGGKFLLRIEDTDQERRVPGAIRYIIEEMAQFGVMPDEGPSHEELKTVGEFWEGAPNFSGPFGPYIQSQRLARYKEVSEHLIKIGAAYRCDCTPEMLEKERLEQMARREQTGYTGYCRTRNVGADTKHVVRIKMPLKRNLSYIDAVKGRISWEPVPLRDSVLLKSDGYPTYNFAVVVDDHDMKISHVMRGDEFVSTTPIHLLLYEALGWEPPVIAHLPNVMGADGKKLSKRHGSTSLSTLREEGYLTQALLNYTVLVGWSPGKGEEQEVFTREELVERFSLDHINPASAIFDYNKLQWMNGLYIRNLSPEAFTNIAAPFIEKAGLKIVPTRWNAIATQVQERLKVLTEIPEMIEFLCLEHIKRDLPAMFKKDIDQEKALTILRLSKDRLATLSDFNVQTIEGVLRPLAEELGLKAGPMFGVIRIAVTGKTVTPPLFESLVALGKADTLKRIEETIAEVSALKAA